MLNLGSASEYSWHTWAAHVLLNTPGLEHRLPGFHGVPNYKHTSGRDPTGQPAGQRGEGERAKFSKVPRAQKYPPLSQHLSSEHEPEPDLSSRRAGACQPHAHWLLWFLLAPLLSPPQPIFHSMASAAEKSNHCMWNLHKSSVFLGLQFFFFPPVL